MGRSYREPEYEAVDTRDPPSPRLWRDRRGCNAIGSPNWLYEASDVDSGGYAMKAVGDYPGRAGACSIKN